MLIYYHGTSEITCHKKGSILSVFKQNLEKLSQIILVVIDKAFKSALVY